MNNKPIVLVTGATSGLGKAAAEVLLKHDRQVIVVVRDAEKAQKIFGDNRDIRIIPSNLEDASAITSVIKTLHDEGGTLFGAVLAAGGAPRDAEGKAMFNDSQYPGATPAEQEAEAYKVLYPMNVLTKVTFFDAFRAVYGKHAVQKLLLFGSHIADAPEGDPMRIDEEAYVHCMIDIKQLAADAKKDELCDEVYLKQPGLVKTSLTQNSPFLSKLLETNPYREPNEYLEEVLSETGFI